ncbi:MAG: ATP-grasp domain-containing protein [Methylotenera sp.]|nr:ATP-grasp domain-containing protein [Oligoflexia bacterium]
MKLFHRHSLLAVSLLLALSQAWAAGGMPFHRVVKGDRPNLEQQKIDAYIYGAPVLYTGDAKAPTHVPGAVWHAKNRDKKFYFGDLNPAVDPDEIMQLVEDEKWEESKILLQNAPWAYPRTENVQALLEEFKAQLGSKAGTVERQTFLRDFALKLKERYPMGYFLKAVDGLESNGGLPTEKTDGAEAYALFERNIKAKKAELYAQGMNDEQVHTQLRTLPGYSGMVFDDIFSRPHKVIVQAKIPVNSFRMLEDGKLKSFPDEYRVHSVQGKILSGGTQYRWDYHHQIEPEALKNIETFAQKVVNALPAEMRKMSFGMDVVTTKDGGMQIIEMNIGGESSYLWPKTDVWVAQLLAEKFTGKRTPMQKDVDQVLAISDLAAKGRALEALLKKPAFASVGYPNDEAVSEILRIAKNSMLESYRQAPSPRNLKVLNRLLDQFQMRSFLTESQKVSITPCEELLAPQIAAH